MDRFLLALPTIALLYGVNALGQNFVAPIDLEESAVRIDVFCNRNAPLVTPTYMQAFRAWKKRLGPYASRYQEYLMRKSSESASAAEIKAMRDEFDRWLEESLAKLETNQAEATAYCRLNISGMLDEAQDDEIKRIVDEYASYTRDKKSKGK